MYLTKNLLYLQATCSSLCCFTFLCCRRLSIFQMQCVTHWHYFPSHRINFRVITYTSISRACSLTLSLAFQPFHPFFFFFLSIMGVRFITEHYLVVYGRALCRTHHLSRGIQLRILWPHSHQEWAVSKRSCLQIYLHLNWWSPTSLSCGYSGDLGTRTWLYTKPQSHVLSTAWCRWAWWPGQCKASTLCPGASKKHHVSLTGP